MPGFGEEARLLPLTPPLEETDQNTEFVEEGTLLSCCLSALTILSYVGLAEHE